MEKKPIPLSAKIENINDKLDLFDHFLRLLPVLKNANLVSGFEKDSARERKEYALMALLKILQLTDGKFPYMLHLTLDREGTVLDYQLHKNPVFDWPFEAMGTLDVQEYLEATQKIREKQLPADFNQSSRGGSISLINPLNNFPQVLFDFNLQEFLKTVENVTKDVESDKNKTDKKEILITGSTRTSLLIGRPNPKFFDSLDTNSPYQKNILNF
jgi:hypothetical protein